MYILKNVQSRPDGERQGQGSWKHSSTACDSSRTRNDADSRASLPLGTTSPILNLVAPPDSCDGTDRSSLSSFPPGSFSRRSSRTLPTMPLFARSISR